MNRFDIGGFTPFTLTDYPGKVAAIVFTQGCNLACPFCHNKALIPIKHTPEDEGKKRVTKVLSILAKRRGKIQGVVVTGGEPTIQPGLRDFLKALKELGLRVKLDTNGTNPGVLRQVLTEDLVDFIAMDIKAPWEKYAKLAGRKLNVDPLKESINLILESGVKCLFRTTFVSSLLTERDINVIKSYIPRYVPFVRQKFVVPKQDLVIWHEVAL